MRERGDVPLIVRAAYGDWPISPEMRRRCVERLMRMIDDPDTKQTVAALCIRSLAILERNNLTRLALELRAESPPQTVVIHQQIDQYATVFTSTPAVGVDPAPTPPALAEPPPPHADDGTRKRRVPGRRKAAKEGEQTDRETGSV